MNSSFVRKAVYLTIGTLLIAISALLVATTFNIQTARAAQSEGGGGALTMHDLISMELVGLNNIVTIHTTTKVNKIDTYVVHPQINIDYYAAKLGNDYICLIQASDPKQTQVCLPFTAIVTITFREQ
jgi:hypothetical protein